MDEELKERITRLVEDLQHWGKEQWKIAVNELIELGPVVVEALKNQGKPNTSYRSNTISGTINVLGKLKDDRAIPALVEMLYRNDGREWGRKHAAETLVEIGFENVGLKDNVTCLCLLGKIDAIAEMGRAVIPLLIENLGDECTGETAAKVLGKTGISDEQFQKIIQMLEGTELHGETFMTIASVVGMDGEKNNSHFDIIVEMLDDENELKRECASAAFTFMEDVSILPALIELMKRRDLRYTLHLKK